MYNKYKKTLTGERRSQADWDDQDPKNNVEVDPLGFSFCLMCPRQNAGEATAWQCQWAQTKKKKSQ